jgi:hypothetical protein
MENWYRKSGLPEDYQIIPTPKGYITDKAAYDWIYFFDLQRSGSRSCLSAIG